MDFQTIVYRLILQTLHAATAIALREGRVPRHHWRTREALWSAFTKEPP